MNKVTFPLNRRMKGPQVADLQKALQVLLDRAAILTNDETARREAAAGLRRDLPRQSYGEATGNLVSVFQRERRLQPSGEVDGPTADALNELLRQLGLLDQERPPAFRLVTGLVRREDGLPLQRARIRATHVSERREIRLGDDSTDEEGRYTIRYDALPGVDAINLKVSAISEDGRTVVSSEVVPNAQPVETIDLTVPIAAPAGERRTIEGAILLEHGLPAEKLTLRLYRRDFGGKATLLSETTTVGDGRYAFSYDAGSRVASLEVRAVKPDGKEVPLSKPLNDLTAEAGARLNLLAPDNLQPLGAEYRRLSADLTPHVGQMAKLVGAKEDAEQQDLAVLNRVTGWDARLIALAATAERLSQDPEVELASEALYGLLRTGLPSDKALLAQVEPGVAIQALQKARTTGIIGMQDAEIKRFQSGFAAFADKTQLAMPAPGSRSTYADILKASGLPADAQARFASVFLPHRGDDAGLWDAARKAGLDDSQVGKLRMQGKWSFLAGNGEAMTTRLLNKGMSSPVELVGIDLYRPDAWAAEIFDQAGIPAVRRNALTDTDRQKLNALIPAGYGGEQAEARLSAYAEDMARKVRISYPTQVIHRRMATDPLYRLPAAHDSTLTLLKNAAEQGFRLGETPVAAFLKSKPAVRGGLNDTEFAAAARQMKSLQRIYQITPLDDAIPVLMSLGITSAYDVTAYPEPQFVLMFERKYLDIHHLPAPEGTAVLISRKAKQVSSVTYNLFTIAKKLDAEPPIAGLSAPLEVLAGVKNELIKHYPTMESLFGSMDYCECDHCRSVLSPAAYLVDLLQFVDAEPGVWGNFLAQWSATHGGAEYQAGWNTRPDGTARPAAERKPYDALIERRPDLPHIALTCENTHTALPYVDVVNEVLEYYLAHGKLEAAAARDTGDATTAELMAEPQNVIREAYDTLRAAHYPLDLPFDLWIDTVRQFCDYFEAPLHQVLEAFRRSDDLLAPGQSFDRAAIFAETLRLSPSDVALFTHPDPLGNDWWHGLYGFPAIRSAIHGPTNVGDATLSVANADAAALVSGLAYTFFRVGANTLSGESKTLASVGVPNSGGAGRATVRLVGTWVVAPVAGDLLVCDGAGMLTSAKTLSRRLGVTYKELAQIVASGFVNAELGKLSILYKLGVSIADARFYIANKALIPQNPGTLSTDDQKRRLEAKAFADALVDLAATYQVPVAQLEAAIQAIPFNRALVLADPDAGCSFDRTLLQYSDGTRADPIVFLSINHFVRLWRALRWTLEETDRALQAFVPKNAPFESAHLAKRPLRTALIYLAHLKTLDERVKVGKESRSKLLTLWSDLATTGQKPLYAQLFLTPGVLRTAPVFDHPLGQYLANPAIALQDHLVALQGALGLAADDIARILTDAGTDVPTAVLSIPNVSLLYRYGVLAKALKLPVRDLIALKQLSGLDPFKALSPDPLQVVGEDHPFSETLEFLAVASEMKDAGFKVADLDYLLRHRFDETGKYRPDPVGTLALLKSLSEGVRAIRAEHAVPDDPSALSDEVLRLKLGLVLPADVVGTFLAMMNGTAEFTATRTGVAAAAKLSPEGFADEPGVRDLPYNAARQEQKLTYRGVLFDTERTALVARLPKPSGANPHVPSPLLGQLLGDVQLLARGFFDHHLLKQAPGVVPGSGFLDAADYDLLFAPPAPGLTDVQLQALDRQRRTRMALAFLPFLQQRLIRELIVNTMIARTGGDPVLVGNLLTDHRLLASPTALVDAFAATGERALTATFRASVDGTGVPLATVSVADADTGSVDKDGTARKPAGSNSARLEGYLEVPATGAYRFLVELDKQNAEAELRFPHRAEAVFLKGAAPADKAILGDRPSDFLELQAGVLYRFSLALGKLNGGNARLTVQGETLRKGPLSQLVLYPAAALDTAERALVLLAKSLQLLQSLALGEREIRHILAVASANFGDPNLGALPTTAVGDIPAETALTEQRFGWFRRLVGYARLQRDLAGGTDALIAIFEANKTLAADRLDAQVYPLLATLTRRDKATVKIVAELLSAAPAFASDKPVQRLWEALQLVERFGVPPASLSAWTGIVNGAATPDQRFAIARDLKNTIKARFDAEAWHRVAQQIFDKLRQRQRNALVSHIMHQHGFERVEQLYEYFLIDPGMEPVVQTSRIRLALGSLQLFIQRCLLNLELKVHPSTINARHWEWMKRYRVWEANRKIFLFPENWLEPEFRDDKTHLFNELEGALLEGDVSSDLVEDAFLNYLKKLDELARLDITALHLEDSVDPAGRILHVFGRTFGQPHKYFYRRFAHQMWTPWEPVTTEIEGDHLAPVIWRDRLYLFWLTFMEKADPNPSAGSSGSPKVAEATFSTMLTNLGALSTYKQVEVHLHWSEYLQGEWSTHESGGFDPLIVGRVPASFQPGNVFVHVSKEYDPTDGSELGVFVHMGGDINRAFYLAARNSTPQARSYGAKLAKPFSSASTELATRYRGQGPFKVSFEQRISTEPGKPPQIQPSNPSILGQSEPSGDPYTVLPCNNALLALGASEDAYREATNPAAVKAAIESGLEEIGSLLKPAFYQDSRHTLFLVPDVAERTIEQWEEWVTRTPQAEPAWRIPEWWDELVVIAERPWKGPLPDPGDPWRVLPDSLITPRPDRDWLVNPTTAIRFGDVLVGPAGQPGIAIVATLDDTKGHGPLSVNSGSGLAGGTTVVIDDAKAFARSGLKAAGSGVNIVGGSGFNSALAQNFNDQNRSGFGADAPGLERLGR